MQPSQKIAPVVLSEYNPEWIKMFEEEKKKILEATAGHNISIEHAGSTAIPGATAKPEIDIMIGTETLAEAETLISPLESIGYIYFKRFEESVPERRYLRKSDGTIPLFHIHMVEKKSDFWKEHMMFRDFLRTHPEMLERYNNFKKEFVSENGDDRQVYSKAKEKIVFEIIEAAKKSVL